MEQNQNIQEIDVRKIVRVVSEHWWWFAAGIAFFMLLGTLYYLRKNAPLDNGREHRAAPERRHERAFQSDGGIGLERQYGSGR